MNRVNQTLTRDPSTGPQMKMMSRAAGGALRAAGLWHELVVQSWAEYRGKVLCATYFVLCPVCGYRLPMSVVSMEDDQDVGALLGGKPRGPLLADSKTKTTTQQAKKNLGGGAVAIPESLADRV
jgi:hypothetical protein